MFEFLTANPAVVFLKEDHDRVKELFDRFEAAKSRPAKVKIVRAALTELKVHAAIEEELFYPAVRAKVGKEVMNEADEEHHVAKLLIAELDAMDGSERLSGKWPCGKVGLGARLSAPVPPGVGSWTRPPASRTRAT